MIGQYLSNTNESATVLIFQNFLELNKASDSEQVPVDSDLTGKQSDQNISRTFQ